MERKTSLKKSPLRRKRTLVGSSSGLRPKRTLQGQNGASRRVSKPKKKVWKFKKTELAECDSAFSREIIARDGHCMYPDCEKVDNLTCSHYIGRANWNTRFDPDNCITLCIRHHFMDRDTALEFQKAREGIHGWDGRYTLFMQEWLRPVKWMFLLERAEGKKSRKEAILETQKRYNLRQPTESGDNANQDTTPEV